MIVKEKNKSKSLPQLIRLLFHSTGPLSPEDLALEENGSNKGFAYDGIANQGIHLTSGAAQ